MGKPDGGGFFASMNRRRFLGQTIQATGCWSLLGAVLPTAGLGAAEAGARLQLDSETVGDWRARWEKSILGDMRRRYCDTEMGEELGWLISPFLNGFLYGYRATGDMQWVRHLVDWMDALLQRAVTEPDGYLGWPKGDGGGGDSTVYRADSMLGEAMVLRPVVLLAHQILTSPELAQWSGKAREYLALAERIFAKWDSRHCWREVSGGGLWVVAHWGIDLDTGKWSAGYREREITGFSNPANKQNHIARWLLTMQAVTQKAVYRERAEKWFQLFKSRIKLRADDKYAVWNYWDPAGPWDWKSNGAPWHWVGVHPNGGYYQIDVEGIVAAFEQGVVFSRSDIDRLIATNRDFMWDQNLRGAKFQRIDGGESDARWKNSPGLLWTALVPYDETLKRIFVANHDPASWGGLATTPWALALAVGK